MTGMHDFWTSIQIQTLSFCILLLFCLSNQMIVQVVSKSAAIFSLFFPNWNEIRVDLTILLWVRSNTKIYAAERSSEFEFSIFARGLSVLMSFFARNIVVNVFFLLALEATLLTLLRIGLLRHLHSTLFRDWRLGKWMTNFAFLFLSVCFFWENSLFFAGFLWR